MAHAGSASLGGLAGKPMHDVTMHQLVCVIELDPPPHPLATQSAPAGHCLLHSVLQTVVHDDGASL